MALQDRITDIIENTGVSGFGIAMPTISPAWTDGALPTANDADLSLRLSNSPASNTWLAPFAGVVQKIDDLAAPSTDEEGASPALKTLVKPDGSFVRGPGLLLTIYPQLYLRLSRLYLQLLEDPASAGVNPVVAQARNLGHAVRPVPRHFFFAGTLTGDDKNGSLTPGGEIGKNGELTIYDNNGFPIDPLAVAAALNAILVRHPVLQQRDLGNTPNTASMQITNIANLAGTTPQTRCWLSTPNGQPYDGANLTGLAPSPPQSSGLFSLDTSSGGTPAIGVAAASGSFSAEQRRLLLIGPATSGRFGESFVPPSLPSGITLQRDFFNIALVQLETYLLGNPSFPGADLEQKPAIRTNEPLSLLADGNDLLGAAAAAIPAGATESLAVAPAINGNFPTPTETGENAHWPNFPPASGSSPSEVALSIGQRDSLNPTAAVFDDGDSNTAKLDVILTLNNLPEKAAVRVYNRKFTPEAKEERGDGAGGIVPAGGTISLRLKDPLGIRTPGATESTLSIPRDSVLFFDLIVVLRNTDKSARIFGNLGALIDTTSPTSSDPTPSDANRFGAAARRGVSNAAILGLAPPDCSISAAGDFLEALKCLSGETNPRDASRFPTMGRRDLLVAGLSGGNWSGLIGAGNLSPEAHSADQRLGAPGGLGGKETQTAAAFSQNGQLAYDLARMALRRTDNIIDRLQALADNNWNEPNALALGSGNAGPVAGAVLQTIAPFSETPELGLLNSVISPAALPNTFRNLLNFIIRQIGNLLPGATPGRAALLNQIRTQLNNLLTSIGITPQNRERLYDELKRELVTSAFGRRDAQWALGQAIDNARHFIYIESAGFTATRKDYAAAGETVPSENYHLDLIEKLQNRLGEVPGLHLIICTPKTPDYGKGYEPFAAFEAHSRNALIRNLPKERVVSFHPVGFPGRPSRLESTAVIVDDLWAIIGSSTFRRRGLTFDGGSDLVLTDTERIGGKSPLISNFRRRLLATRLGIREKSTDDFGTLSDPNFIRLNDGIESFYLIREMLIAGGLGKVGRLFKAPEPPPTDGLSIDFVNPDGQEFDLPTALVTSLFSSLNSF